MASQRLVCREIWAREERVIIDNSLMNTVHVDKTDMSEWVVTSVNVETQVVGLAHCPWARIPLPFNRSISFDLFTQEFSPCRRKSERRGTHLLTSKWYREHLRIQAEYEIRLRGGI